MKSDIKNHVQHIVNTLERGFEDEVNSDGEEFNAFEYLSDILDIEYIINSRRELLGVRILVAFGGPNIWINTRTNQVEGYWWGDTCIMSYTDNVGLDEAVQEMYACTV